MMAIDRKQLIIEAAKKSFSLFGYKATTMDQVAKLANVGKGTIYTFFKNKEELFDEIILSLSNEMKVAAEEAIDPSLSFHENIYRALYAILDFRNKHQLTIKLFHEESEMGTPAAVEGIKKLEEAIINYTKEKVAVAIEKGEIRECDPKLTAYVMLKLFVALVFDWEKTNEPLDREQMAHLFELYLMKGLSK